MLISHGVQGYSSHALITPIRFSHFHNKHTKLLANFLGVLTLKQIGLSGKRSFRFIYTLHTCTIKALLSGLNCVLQANKAVLDKHNPDCQELSNTLNVVCSNLHRQEICRHRNIVHHAVITIEDECDLGMKRDPNGLDDDALDTKESNPNPSKRNVNSTDKPIIF